MTDLDFEVEVEHSVENDSGNGSNPSAGSYDPYPDEVVNYLIHVMQNNGNDIEIPLHREDARELTDKERDYLSLGEDAHFCVVDIFDVDTDSQYVGAEPGAQEDCGDCDEGTPCEYHDIETDRNITSDISKRVNGHHIDTIWSEYDEQGSIRVGMGKKSRHNRDVVERRRYVRFWYSATQKMARSAKRAQFDADDDFSETDYIEWCLDNDLHPQPRKKDTPELDWYRDNKKFA